MESVRISITRETSSPNRRPTHSPHYTLVREEPVNRGPTPIGWNTDNTQTPQGVTCTSGNQLWIKSEFTPVGICNAGRCRRPMTQFDRPASFNPAALRPGGRRFILPYHHATRCE